MKRYPFMQVDAFTSEPMCGNPCAVVLDADGLDEERMQRIARENNLSETAFVMRSDRADVRVRYFTPVEEVPMAGHPTIATVHALIESERFIPEHSRGVILLEMQVGIIPVTIENDTEDDHRRRISMEQQKPQFHSKYEPERVASWFGLPVEAINRSVPIQTVSTGTPQLFCMVASLDALRAAHMPLETCADEMRSCDFFSCHLLCPEGATPEGQTFARHFTLPPGAFEDPFTGSATGGMGAYLWRYGCIEAPHFIAEQGHWMGRPGQAHVSIDGPRDDIRSVHVAGHAVTVIEGVLSVPS